MKYLIKIYNKIILRKSSVITFILSVVLILGIILYMLIDQKNGYLMYSDIVHQNYISTLGTIITVSIVFLITFFTQRESNLLTDSFDVMIETKKGRTYVFFVKQIVYISFCLLFSLIFYILSFLTPYFIFDLFKIDFLFSFLSYFLFSLTTLELALFINYLTKNFFVTLMFSLVVVIKEMINLPNINYIIPGIIFENGIVLDTDYLYNVIYVIMFIILNYILYRFKDRT